MSTSVIPACNVMYDDEQFYQEYSEIGAAGSKLATGATLTANLISAVSFLTLFIIFLIVTYSVWQTAGIGNAGTIFLIVLTICSFGTCIGQFIDYYKGKTKYDTIKPTEKISNCVKQTDTSKLTKFGTTTTNAPVATTSN